MSGQATAIPSVDDVTDPVSSIGLREQVVELLTAVQTRAEKAKSRLESVIVAARDYADRLETNTEVNLAEAWSCVSGIEQELRRIDELIQAGK